MIPHAQQRLAKVILLKGGQNLKWRLGQLEGSSY